MRLLIAALILATASFSAYAQEDEGYNSADYQTTAYDCSYTSGDNFTVCVPHTGIGHQ